MTDICKDNSPWYAKLLEVVLLKAGVPFVVLGVGMLGLYQSGQWFGQTIAEPAVRGHIQTMQRLGDQMEAQTAILHETQETNKLLLEQVERNADTMQKGLMVRPAQVLEAVERIERTLKEDQQ